MDKDRLSYYASYVAYADTMHSIMHSKKHNRQSLLACVINMFMRAIMRSVTDISITIRMHIAPSA